jgi:hypothetical protein
VDFTVKVDPASAGAPDTTITQGPPDLGKACETSVPFAWTGTDNLTEPAALTYAYKLDNGDWSGYAADATHLFENLSEGLHTVQVRAKDGDGNVDPTPAGRQFYVDLTAPTLTNITGDIRDFRATIAWTTSEPATGEVEYGETDQYGSTTGVDGAMAGAHRMVLANLKPLTTYHYRLKSGDGCRTTLSEDRTFTTTDILKPDLSLVEIKTPPDAGTLQHIEIKWRVQNVERGDAAAPWTDTVYLSEKSTLDASAVPMGSFTMNQPLAEMESYQQVQRLKVPLKPLGKFYVLVKTDANEQVTETSEADNVKASPVELLQTNNLVAGPDRHAFTLNPTEAQQGRFDLGNLSSQTLTGLSAVVQGAPANVSIQFSLPQSLTSLQVAPASFSVVAADESVLKASPTVTIRSAEGEQAVITLDLTVIQRKPVLTASPGTLDGGMVRGKQATVECEVTNSGSVAATGLIVDIPAATWFSLTTPQQPADIPPGGKAKIGLALRPSATQALGPYTGQVLLRGSGINLPIGFRFVCASEAKGDLKIIAEDEYTYFAEAKPPVAGAKVKVTNAATGAVVAEGITDAAGAFTALNVPEGSYNLEASEERHTTHRSTIVIEPGRETQAKAFMGRNLVTYNWTVVPVETEDHYTVTLETTFETHVPAPVVTIDPAYLDLRKLSFDSTGKAVVNFTITNHGFITANDAELLIGENSRYAATAPARHIGQMPALSTVVLPVTFERLVSALDSAGQCLLPISVRSCYMCGENLCRDSPSTIVTDTCGGGGGGGSLWWLGGGSSAYASGPPMSVSQPLVCCDVDGVPMDVSFSSHNAVSADTGAAYDPPHWVDTDGDGKAATVGERNFPVSYAIGAKFRVTARFLVTRLVMHGPACKLMVRGTDLPERDALLIGKIIIYPESESLVPAGTSVAAQLRSINWELSTDGGTSWKSLGTTEHRLYITLATPTQSPLYESCIDIACHGASGTPAGDTKGATDKVWSVFASLSVNRKAVDGYNRADGMQMGYWLTDTPPQDLPGILGSPNGDGSCRSWALLLRGALACHGIASSMIEVTPNAAAHPGADGFLVRNWQFPAHEDYPASEWPYKWSAVIDKFGVAAQKNADPTSAFGNHFITYCTSGSSRYYDPSYGTAFATTREHEEASIDGLLSGTGRTRKNDADQDLVYGTPKRKVHIRRWKQ